MVSGGQRWSAAGSAAVVSSGGEQRWSAAVVSSGGQQRWSTAVNSSGQQ
ncbi:MAG: hypothetical protein SNJ09_04290 [Rikenellaceae bacterium]